MTKGFDPSIVNPIMTGFIEELITAQGGLVPSKPHEIAAKPVDEYEGRMRVNALEKFDASVYIAAISFYLNQADMKAHRACGALILYMDIEVADKIFKAAGLEVPYDEDDEDHDDHGRHLVPNDRGCGQRPFRLYGLFQHTGLCSPRF